MDLFDKDGAYNFRSFKGENGTWTLTGSESGGEGNYEDRFKNWWETSIAMTVDYFKSEKGVSTFFTRGRVYQFWKADQIAPVPESIIKMGSYDKKMFSQALGRA